MKYAVRDVSEDELELYQVFDSEEQDEWRGHFCYVSNEDKARLIAEALNDHHWASVGASAS